MTSVYVVYHIDEEGDFDILQIFKDYTNAKIFQSQNPNTSIWQRPIIE